MFKKNVKINWNYSSLAKFYDLRADYSPNLIKKILLITKCKKYYPVADIGAGTGKLTKLLCSSGLIVNAVEPNKNMRLYGKQNTKLFDNLNWSTGSGEVTGLKDKSVYFVFFGSSFNTVNYKKASAEIKRIVIKNGYFCCMWNHRVLNNDHQKNIEKIILKKIPDYNYGDRRIDYKNILKKLRIFTNIKKISQRFHVKISKKDFINGWKSHATLKKNCSSQRQFDDIIRLIANYISSIKGKYINVPYDNVAYVAKLK